MKALKALACALALGVTIAPAAAQSYPAKPVRIVDSEESFETPLVPGLVINAVDVFQR